MENNIDSLLGVFGAFLVPQMVKNLPAMQKTRYFIHNVLLQGFPDGTGGQEPSCKCKRRKRHGLNPWVRKIPWRRAWQPTQYSCLKNPMDRRAWWAIVHRVTKSRTWLKWLSMHTGTQSLSITGWARHVTVCEQLHWISWFLPQHLIVSFCEVVSLLLPYSH